VKPLVKEKKGRLFRRKDGKYLLYLPKDLCEDSGFPFPLDDKHKSVKLTVTWEGHKLIAQ
jgi:hypothetical protein